MGFKLNGIHSDTFGIAVTTIDMPYIAPKRQTTIEVNGRDGQYIFEDGYNNIIISLACKIGGYDMSERRKRARAIAAWLNTKGPLIFDYESDMEYTVVKIVSDISANVQGREYRDEFNIAFECEPFQTQTYHNDKLTWDTIDSAWIHADMPWMGYTRIFAVTSGQNISLTNTGTHSAYPVIKLSGVADIVNIGGLIFTDIDGDVYIDCKNKLAYSKNGASKINRINNLYGAFLEIRPGANTFLVTGTITNLTIEFDYRNTYI